MGRGTLGAAPSRTSLGRASMGTPGRRLAHETWSLGTRLASTEGGASALESPRIDAGLHDQRDDDGDERHADEFAAVSDRRVRPKHAARGAAGAQCNPYAPMNLAVYSEKQ